MNDKLDQTRRILRSPKVTTDERGRTVRADTVETAKLEVVSAKMLKQMMSARMITYAKWRKTRKVYMHATSTRVDSK